MSNPVISTPEQIAILRDEFNTRWRASFEKSEADNAALRELVKNLADELRGRIDRSSDLLAKADSVTDA